MVPGQGVMQGSSEIFELTEKFFPVDKIKCLIIDDEEPARRLVTNYVNRLPHLQISGQCANPLQAMEILQHQKVDIIFLDIQMPELTGVEFLKTLSYRPLVIFTTAYKEYALEGYELDVVDYLLKPFRFERFVQAVNKATNLLKKSESSFSLSDEPRPPKDKVQKDYILVKSDYKVFRIYYKDIIFIESMKEYINFHTPEGRTLSLGSLKNLDNELPTEEFIRIHKSYIVNKKKVTALEGNLVHIGKKKLPIGSSYRKEVLKALF